jgi:hypothetical protein
MPVGVAVLSLLLEVHGPVHFEAICHALREEGLHRVPDDAERFTTESARQRHPARP